MAKDKDEKKDISDALGGMSGKAASYIKGRRGAIDDAVDEATGDKKPAPDNKPAQSKKWYE